MSKVFLSMVTAVLFTLHVGVGYLYAVGQEAFPEVPTPRVYLAQQCEEIGCDFALLDAIITCESKWIMVQNHASSAYGYFQILDSTEQGTPQYQSGGSKMNPYVNIDMGIYLYERYGTSPWNESRPCWSWRYQLTQDTI